MGASRPSPALRLTARAKLNLWLYVTGKRPDGYHELLTLFQELDWGDELVARRTEAPGVTLRVRAADGRAQAPPGDDNLVARAARAWFEASGAAWGVEFALHKRVPAGAGLGGGSSDAAAALRLLQALAGPSACLESARLHRVAAALGADVPFFLAGGAQVGLGTGTELRRVEGAPASEVLLVLPPFGCDTRAVYENFRPQWIAATPPVSLPTANPVPFNQLAVPQLPRNDLQKAACAAYPELGCLIDTLVSSTGRADLRMSGSGSTLFVADTDSVALDAAQLAIEAAGPAVGSLVRTSWSSRSAANPSGSACIDEPQSCPWPEGSRPDHPPRHSPGGGSP